MPLVAQMPRKMRPSAIISRPMPLYVNPPIAGSNPPHEQSTSDGLLNEAPTLQARPHAMTPTQREVTRTAWIRDSEPAKFAERVLTTSETDHDTRTDAHANPRALAAWGSVDMPVRSSGNADPSRPYCREYTALASKKRSQRSASATTPLCDMHWPTWSHSSRHDAWR